VAGSAVTPGGTQVPFVMTSGSSMAVPFPSAPSGGSIFSLFINSSGQLAGTEFDGAAFFGNSAGVSMVPGSANVLVNGLSSAGVFSGYIPGTPDSALTGTAGGITSLPFSQALAISNSGLLLVIPETGSGPGGLLFTPEVYNGSTAVPIDIGGFTINPLASGLNDSGQVVGPIFVFGPPGSGFVATASSLSQIAGQADGLPWYINNLGVVVGATAQQGFVWDSTNGKQSLSSLVAPGWTILDPEGINDSGQIVAFAQFDGGAEEPVLLTPLATPEPSTISMMLATIAFFTTVHFARRRRLQPHNVVARVDE
jgi:hypothetical protein